MEIKIPHVSERILAGLLDKASEGFYDFLGENIKKLRLYKGFTQRYVANHLGVSYQQYQKYERGKNRISVQFIIKLMDLFKVDIYEILGQKNPNEEILERMKELEISYVDLETSNNELKNSNVELKDKQESQERANKSSNEEIKMLKAELKVNTKANEEIKILKAELKRLHELLDK